MVERPNDAATGRFTSRNPEPAATPLRRTTYDEPIRVVDLDDHFSWRKHFSSA